MARPCTACSSRHSAEINAALITGAAVADVSRKYDVGDSSLYRHARAHLSASVLQEVRASETVGSTDLIERLTEALDDVSAVRNHALLSGHASTVLRAASATQSLVETLLDRLGIDNIEIVRLLREGENFAFAIAQAIRRNPEIAPLVAVQLRARGAVDEAEALERVQKESELVLEMR